MATPLVEAKATTLPRRAAVDPAAGAAERESAKFISRTKREEGKDEKGKRK